MALLGQASGGFTESSSALRILHVGIRNTVGVLTADAFLQSNPPVVTDIISEQIDPAILGVLSGSVAFTRGDADGGSNEIGGPHSAGGQGGQPVGCFINTAVGNSFENQPGAASGKGPYVSAQGTYANATFETLDLGGNGAITYTTGDNLVASRNGYLTTTQGFLAAGGNAVQNSHCASEVNGGTLDLLNEDTDVLIGVLKMPSDATQDEIVYDQRI